MSCDSKQFTNMETIRPKEIEAANGMFMTATHKGTVDLGVRVDDKNAVVQLDDVLYVPGLTKNLFSTGTVVRKGFTIIQDQDKISFTKMDKVVLV